MEYRQKRSLKYRTKYGYDAVGNLTKKTDYSTDSTSAYRYTANTNKVNRVQVGSNKYDTFAYDNKGNLTHSNGSRESTYNVFNKPTKIVRMGSTVELTYGADLMRTMQQRVVDNKTITTHYIDKLYEVETSDDDSIRRSYIAGVAIVEESANEETIRFTHKDRLGSAVTFTDEDGSVTARRYFDPFGKPRGGDWRTLDTVGARLLNNMFDTDNKSRRGFTDHEHLDEVELIHMNGRVYDYNLGRFLSVDPLVHDGSQGINPYSYIMHVMQKMMEGNAVPEDFLPWKVKLG